MKRKRKSDYTLPRQDRENQNILCHEKKEEIRLYFEMTLKRNQAILCHDKKAKIRLYFALTRKRESDYTLPRQER